MRWRTYITNDVPATGRYRVTVIVSWVGGGAGQNANNFVRLDSLFWSPSGCVSSATHPFSAPCQPFFYGQAEVPQASFSFSGSLHDGNVDLSKASLLTPAAQATLQQEQIIETDGVVTTGGADVTDSTGLHVVGSAATTSQADTDVGSTTATTDGATIANGTAFYLERVQPDAGGSIGLQLTVPLGDAGTNGVSTAAKATDTYACPASGTRQMDSLACAGSQVRQAGTATAVVPLSHALAALGPMTAVRVTAPPSAYSTALVHRNAVSGYDGLIDVSASRTLGTIYLGGFPTAGMTAPAGMSTVVTADNNYCMRISGYADSVSAIAGPRTITNPSTTVSAGGLFYYYSAGSYLSKATDDPGLDSLSVTCTSPAQTVSGTPVTWKVIVDVGAIDRTTTTVTQQTTGDAQTRKEATATVNPIVVTMRYQLIVGTETEVDLTITADLGDLIAKGVYGLPPTPG